MLSDVLEVIGLDQRGCSVSTGAGPFTVKRWLEDLEALREHWRVSRWIVAGHSFGGAIALAYASEFPQRAVAAISISCALPMSAADMQRAIDEHRENQIAAVPPFATGAVSGAASASTNRA